MLLQTSRSRAFYIAKRVFDILISITLLPIFLLACLVLLALNPLFNKGRLFYPQLRMGRDCKSFVVYKFRSMRDVERVQRGHNDPLEVDRITPLGQIIRRTRIDELPQILNVLRGDMSLIGPRPDYFHHARKYVRSVPGYRERYQVRPGISGLAQVEIGYAFDAETLAKKVDKDLFYINNSCFRLEARIFCRTLIIVCFGRGA